MSEINVRADAVNVEQIMEQIRARIREKRGVDYTEQQVQELAKVRLEKFLDPRGLRSDLLEQYRRATPPYEPPELPNYRFEDTTLFESHRAPLRFIRRLLNPILKLFFNPNPLIQALNIQSRLNTMYAEREAKREAARHALDQLNYEVIHNLVLETTRMSIEVKNLKMRIESLTSRLEFNERRARALESVVVYKPSAESGGERAVPPAEETSAAIEGAPAAAAAQGAAAAGTEGPGQRSRRRRRRRGRRGGGSAAAIMGVEGQDSGAAQTAGDAEIVEADALRDDEGPEGEEAPSQEASSGDQAPRNTPSEAAPSSPSEPTSPDAES